MSPRCYFKHLVHVKPINFPNNFTENLLLYIHFTKEKLRRRKLSNLKLSGRNEKIGINLNKEAIRLMWC